MKTRSRRMLVVSLLAASCLSASSMVASAASSIPAAPKYVFCFVGDGMGIVERQAAEYYLRVKEKAPAARLLMNTFPVAGLMTTDPYDSTEITDSSAAGSALTTGHKIKSGMVAMLPDGTKVRTIFEAAQEKGYGIGLVTTGSLTGATPASFMAHIDDRDKENEIAASYLLSGVDFFAGGGYGCFIPKDSKTEDSEREDNRDLLSEFKNAGYEVFAGSDSADSFRKYQPKVSQKVFAAFTAGSLPYEIDRVNQAIATPSLAEITAKGIDVLAKNPKGFFMMVEGDRIDDAGHMNDVIADVTDVIALDEAVAKAFDFYTKHPTETLLIVMTDHETGGMTLGRDNNEFLRMDQLLGAKVTAEDTLKYAKKDRDGYFKTIGEKMGMPTLTPEERASIIEQMDVVDNSEESFDDDENPVTVTTMRLLGYRANIGWSTFEHTSSPVPLTAIGVGSEYFGGYTDNTDFAKSMAKLMDFTLTK